MLAMLLGVPTLAGAAPAVSPVVRYPADQAAHARVQNEWWYVVGHLQSGGRRFGYEMTIFKFDHVRPPGLNVALSLYRTDIAITDESARRFHQNVTYYFAQSAHVSYNSLQARVGTAALIASSAGRMQLSASIPQGKLALNLTSRRRPMLVGGRGYIPFGNGYTYYYSLTDLGTSGTMTVAGRRYSVIGISWLDHQWGNWAWQTIRGWTWMALQLDNGTQLSVFDFRGTTTRVKAASVLLASGGLRTAYDATIRSSGAWRSPHTGTVYPSAWTVRIPSLHAVLNVTPSVSDQELVVPSSAAQSYWEGSGRVAGTFAGKPVKGESYTELTGFARAGA